MDAEESAFEILKSRETQLKDIKTKNTKKPRKTTNKIVAGKEINTEIIERLKEHDEACKQNKYTGKMKKTNTKDIDTDKKSKI